MRRTVIIGDIHGCFDELLELLQEVNLRPDDLLVSVGDLVDRGPAPGEVVRFFRERPNSVVVMGNHERKHVRGIFSYAQEITRLQLGERYAETVRWMRTLPYFFENEHVRVVHAAMLPGVPPAEQREEILCGSTSGERELAALFPDSHWHDHYTDAKPVVVGHHVDRAGADDPRRQGLRPGHRRLPWLEPDRAVRSGIHGPLGGGARGSLVDRQAPWQLPVLKSKPWHGFTWSELTATIARFSSAPDVATRGWLETVEKWAADLRSSFPALVAAAHRVADELTTDELRRHPAAQCLFQARNGRLDQTSLARQCSTPRRTVDLAAALGLTLPELPD